MEQAELVPLPAALGVGGGSRVVVTVTVWVPVTFRPVSEMVVVPVEVLELVTDPVVVGEPVSVAERPMVRVGLREIRVEYVLRSVAVIVGEADRVLLVAAVLDPVAEKVLVLDTDALAVSVLEPPMLRV